MVELGRLDITMEVSLLSQYLTNPRIGHVEQAIHMLSYVKNHHHMDLCYDPTKLIIQEDTIDLNNTRQHEQFVCKRCTLM